jgi:hypothetical protein
LLRQGCLQLDRQLDPKFFTTQNAYMIINGARFEESLEIIQNFTKLDKNVSAPNRCA